MEDREIVEKLFFRDDTALEELEKKYGSRLLKLAGRFLRSREDAEEAVSDAWLRAWNTIPPNRPEHLFAYLAKLCRYAALEKVDWLTAGKRSAVVVELTEELSQCLPDPAFEREREGREIGEVLDDFLAGLDREKRVMFLRRYWYGDPIREVAARCGVGESRAETMVKDLIDTQTNPTIATYAKTGEVHIRVTANGEDKKSAGKLIKPVVKELKARFGNHVYTTDETVTLEKSVVDLLLANVCKLNVTRYPYEIVRLMEDIAGGIMVTAPSEADLKSPEVGKYVEKYLVGCDVSAEDRLRCLRLCENLALGTAAVGYRTESMHGAGSPQAQKVMITRQGNFAMKKEIAKRIAGIRSANNG